MGDKIMERVIVSGKPYRKIIDNEVKSWERIGFTDFSIPEDIGKVMWAESQNNKVVKFNRK